MSGEVPAQKNALENAEKYSTTEVVPLDPSGKPLVQIGCAAAELVPTKQYGNCTVGPVTVKRWVIDGDDEHLMEEIHRTQRLCERAVSEDRETVHNMLRQSEQGRLTQ